MSHVRRADRDLPRQSTKAPFSSAERAGAVITYKDGMLVAGEDKVPQIDATPEVGAESYVVVCSNSGAKEEPVPVRPSKSGWYAGGSNSNSVVYGSDGRYQVGTPRHQSFNVDPDKQKQLCRSLGERMRPIDPTNELSVQSFDLNI